MCVSQCKYLPKNGIGIQIRQKKRKKDCKEEAATAIMKYKSRISRFTFYYLFITLLHSTWILMCAVKQQSQELMESVKRKKRAR